jgi:hypothetical protein
MILNLHTHALTTTTTQPSLLGQILTHKTVAKHVTETTTKHTAA